MFNSDGSLKLGSSPGGKRGIGGGGESIYSSIFDSCAWFLDDVLRRFRNQARNDASIRTATATPTPIPAASPLLRVEELCEDSAWEDASGVKELSVVGGAVIVELVAIEVCFID